MKIDNTTYTDTHRFLDYRMNSRKIIQCVCFINPPILSNKFDLHINGSMWQEFIFRCMAWYCLNFQQMYVYTANLKIIHFQLYWIITKKKQKEPIQFAYTHLKRINRTIYCIAVIDVNSTNEPVDTIFIHFYCFLLLFEGIRK